MNNLEEDISKLEIKKSEAKQIKENKKNPAPKIKSGYNRPANTTKIKTAPIEKQANIQKIIKIEEKKDGYNLIVHYFPEGFHTRPNERLKDETYGNDADEDFLSMNIPSLGTPMANQALKVELDDKAEYFTETPRIFLKDINGNNLNLENYLKINYGTLNKTNLNSINISPRGIEASAYLKDGARLLIETKIMNEYGTIENETLEILIGGRQ